MYEPPTISWTELTQQSKTLRRWKWSRQPASGAGERKRLSLLEL
jgi:hypothetical protein